MSEIREKNLPSNGESLKKLFQSFTNGLSNFKAQQPRDFLQTLGLDQNSIQIGFNSGQWHHRKTEKFRAPYVELGVLTRSNVPVNDPTKIPYTQFGNYSLIFPLKDKNGDICNLYAYRFKLQTPKGEYLNDSGVYPHYPKPFTQRLFIVPNIIDGATILQSGILENKDEVLALPDGEWTDEIYRIIDDLEYLDEIIIIGSREADKTKIPNHVKCISIEQDEAINEIWLNYGATGMYDLIKEKIEKFNYENPIDENGFEQITDTEFFYKGQSLDYKISGYIPQNASLLDMQFEISGNCIEPHFVKLNLLNSTQVKDEVYNWTEETDLNYNQIILEFGNITKELQKIRTTRLQANTTSTKKGFSTKQDKEAKQLLKSPKLFDELNKLIGEAGIIGEEKSRLLLFLIVSSYKFKYNLHAVVHTDNVSSGSEFVNQIAGLVPELDTYNIDLTTSRTFRYYGNSTIDNKLLVIPDYSGITSSKAINDLKRLQSKGNIINDAPIKGSDGFLTTVKQEVKGHSASIGACLNSKKYFEGEARTILIGMDTSNEQNQRLMEHDCLLMAGMIDESKQNQAKELLQYIIRNVYPFEVVNPNASILMLPASIPNARMLTLQLHTFVSIIALFNQHQREKDKLNRVIAQKEDIQIGIDLFLDAIMLNLDELDSSTRTFFDRLKKLMLSKSDKQQTKLSSTEIQNELGISKSHCNRYLNVLCKHEFIQKEGHKNTGFLYMVSNWDELNSIRQLIQNKLSESGEPM